MPINIIVVEDYQIILKGIKLILERYPDFRVVGEAKDGAEAVELAGRLKPDIILMDTNLPKLSGFEAARQIKNQNPKTKILMFTTHNNERSVDEARRIGIDGYLAKDCSVDELIKAVQIIIEGTKYFRSLKGKGSSQPQFSFSTTDGNTATPFNTLTKREREVLKLIAEGHTNKEIAQMLFLSVKTIESHRTNIMEKLDAHKTAELVRCAIRNGLISP